MMNNLPEQFVQRYLRMHGPQGKAWLTGFPELLAAVRERWSLIDPQPFSDLSFNYLEKARDPSGRQLVLKIGYPDPELETEALALGHYRGRGAVKLLDRDPSRGALLLERILPGSDLTSLGEDRTATRIAGQVMLELWRPTPLPNPFPTITKWCQGFARYQELDRKGQGPLPDGLVSRAASLARELLEGQREACLLHGDLHHGNILLGEGGRWLAIDPKGVSGERACEVAPLLYNPVPDLLKRPDLEGLLRDRLDILAETTGLNRERMAAWGFVQAVLSSIWSFEDHSGHLTYGTDFAASLLKLI